MSLIFAALVGPTGRVLAFEPSLPEYRRLVTNIRLNDLDNVACFNAAAADFSGDTPFDYHPQFPTQGKMALVEPSYIVSGAARVSVPAITLDSLLGIQPPPHIMKIDVEGAAGSVLRGARTILNSIGPTIFVELHGPEEQAAIRDELLGRGYVAETLEGETILDPTSHWHSPLWCHKPAH
jgi:FkbM family methyltransferase